MIDYLSARSLAKRYDLSVEVMRRKLKSLNLRDGEHYIQISKTIRYNPQKIHDLLISKEERDLSDKILERFMV